MLITSMIIITIMIAFDLNFLDTFWGIDSFFDYMTCVSMGASFFIQYEVLDLNIKSHSVLSDD